MFTKYQLKIHLIIISLFLTTTVFANDVEIVKVVLTSQSGTWRADVTLKHADEGWDHYADAWRLLDEKGNEIGKRTLYHPHVNEQPFTRSLSSFHISDDKKIIFVEAHDKKHGWSSNKVKIDMSKTSGDKYQIILR
jgi:hypothetical protein